MTEDSSSYNHDGWTRENHTLNFRKKGCKAVIVLYQGAMYILETVWKNIDSHQQILGISSRTNIT